MPLMQKGTPKETSTLCPNVVFCVSWLKIFFRDIPQIMASHKFRKKWCFWHTENPQIQGLSRPAETKRNETKRRPRHHQRMTLRGIFRIWILTVRGFFQNDEPGSPRFHRICKLDSWMQVFLMVNTTNTYLNHWSGWFVKLSWDQKSVGSIPAPEGWLISVLELSSDQNLKTLATFQYPDGLIGIRHLCNGLL